VKTFAEVAKEFSLFESIKTGDFVKDPQGNVHRVFDVKGNTLHTGKYRGNNKYGGTDTLHVTKAKKVDRPHDVVDTNESMDNNPTGVKIYHKDAKTGKEHANILFTARSAQEHERDLKKDGHKVTGRSLMYGTKEGQRQSVSEEVMDQYTAAIEGNVDFRDLAEKKLTPAELKKREEVAQAIEREKPGVSMSKKMAIATATAKKVAEEVDELDEATHAEVKKEISAKISKMSDSELKAFAKKHSGGQPINMMRSMVTNDVIDAEMKKRGLKEDIELDEAKKPVGKEDVIKLLVKYGNNPKVAKDMVDKEFDSAVKRHPEATAAKLAEIIRVVAEEAVEEGYKIPSNYAALMAKKKKAATKPSSENEKDLAKLAPPHDKITHADVMVGRGVKKEEAGASKEDEDQFHVQLDRLVHKTFGKRKSEMDEMSSKEKMKRGMYNEESELAEDHFKLGDKVKCIKSGMKGTVTKLDKPSGEGDEKYYTVKRADGKEMKYAPDELSLINEGMMSYGEFKAKLTQTR
jgi:hypothetical protein